MRKKIVAGNWKMNLNQEAALNLIDGVTSRLDPVADPAQVLFFPPFVYLKQSKDLLFDCENVYVGAQNVNDHESGAYTGEVSAAMLSSLEVTHVLVGHSERRQYYMEGHDMLLAKIQRALSHDLIPVYCCGENLDERNAGNHFTTVGEQLEKVLFQLSPEEARHVVLAYEPVWAIGTGRTATSQQAQEIHAFIRQQVQKKFGSKIAENMSILYGGSCKPDNAGELFGCEDVDGGLIGGASLNAEDFVSIVKAII